MTAASATLSAFVDAPRVELARLCRQICLLHENSAAASEASLDHELSEALASVRAAYGAESVHEDDLLELFRAEQLRVTDASLLAELLAPKLAAYFRAQGLPAISSTESKARASASAPRPSPPASASPPLPAAPAGPLGIADLLDGMLEQDRHDERTRRPGARR